MGTPIIANLKLQSPSFGGPKLHWITYGGHSTCAIPKTELLDSKQTPVTHLLNAVWRQASFALLKVVPIVSTASSHSIRETLWASSAACVINKVTIHQAKATHHTVHASSLLSVCVQGTADLARNGRSNLLYMILKLTYHAAALTPTAESINEALHTSKCLSC